VRIRPAPPLFRHERLAMAHRDRRPSPLAGVRRMPSRLIAEATRLRLTGDWRGACAAADVTVEVDLDVVTEAYGPQIASRVADDLSALAPDLVRQYLPSPYQAWTPHYGPAILTGLSSTSDELSAPVSLPDEPILALVGRSPSPGVHLIVTRPAQLGRFWRAMPGWSWRADAVEPRRIAYAESQPQAKPEVDALANGLLSPDGLHPLVHDAMSPGRVQQPMAYAWSWEPVPVRCGGAWHELHIEGGRLVARAHSDAEIDRELALAGLSGPMVPCARVTLAWRTGTGWLPKRLRWQRSDFFAAAARGHADAVSAALDAGFDIRAVDGEGAGLLHYLPWIGPELLPDLLAAGLSPDRRDKQGRTPLHWAYAAGRAVELVEALLDAG